MTDAERFDEAVEMILADRSPKDQMQYLDATQQRMLILAQRIHGSKTRGPSPEFLEELRLRLDSDAPSSKELTGGRR